MIIVEKKRQRLCTYRAGRIRWWSEGREKVFVGRVAAGEELSNCGDRRGGKKTRGAVV